MARVYVGMSGGVDSSLAAALLVEQGHEVTGVYMKNWSQDLPGMKCPWAEDLADAKRVAVQLGIDFKVYDFESEYKQKVVDYMIEEYKLGRTPNPDVMCNQEVKFRLFLDAALADGAEMIATGHYARVIKSDLAESPSEAPYLTKESRGKPRESLDEVAQIVSASEGDSARSGLLLRARDESKDQTYFLYRVTSEALKRTLFPLGDLLKSEVRDMAAMRGLWTAAKRESMGVCFVGSVSMRDFLGEYVDSWPGDIIDKQSGAVIGRHDGAVFYTLGQRHGLDVGGGLPYYVVGKDIEQNIVYASTDLNDESIWRDEIRLNNTHWINGAPESDNLQARLRHRGKLIDCTLINSGEEIIVKLANSERAVTPGQSVVLYKADLCLGGGIVA